MSVIERDIDTMKEELKQRFVTTAQINYGRELSDLSEHELYETLAQVVKQYTSENWIKTNKQYQENDEKQVYYFSIEFLLGRLLNTNLINLDLKNALKAMLQDLDLDIHDLYEEGILERIRLRRQPDWPGKYRPIALLTGQTGPG